jgi:DNA-directed RNA polymerase specialized sigma24 family protein
MTKKKNYVNNKDLLAALIEHKEKCAEAEECGDKNPQVPDYIGKCIMLIAQRLATRPNFSGYMYKDEMVSDGIENCLQYIHNFNPEKSQNPFAYFTQIIWYAFLRRISKEKKQMYIKFKASQRQTLENEVFDSTGEAMDGNVLPDYIYEFINDFEGKLKKTKEKNNTVG